MSAAPKCLECKAAKRATREVRLSLNNLLVSVEGFLARLDAEMKRPSDMERGRRIADLANRLDLAAQMARRFGLRRPVTRKRPAKTDAAAPASPSQPKPTPESP